MRAGIDRFRRRGSGGGFTLLEILIVVVLISIVLAVAIPLLRRGQAAANEAAVIKAMKTIHSVEVQYRLTYNAYGTLADLGPQGRSYIDAVLASGMRNGYRFGITLDSDATWHAVATPLTYGMDGLRTYAIDESGTLRGSDLGKSDLAVPRDVFATWLSVE
jgi:prepilin-type N-terminal cleavage/methylation domain-containing protein